MPPRPARAETVLRIVMNSDLKIVDPIWTTAYIIRNHGYMIYDTLFATDAKGEIKPQMVDKYRGLAPTSSPTPSRCATACLARRPAGDGRGLRRLDQALGARRTPSGQKLMTFVAAHRGQGRRRPSRCKLKEPTGLVLPALGKPDVERALHDAQARRRDRSANTQITDFTGSGPFIFKRTSGSPATRCRLRRNSDIQAARRAGLAAGRRQASPRSTAIEWLAMSDHQQAINALLAGEIDFIEAPPLRPAAACSRRDRNIQLLTLEPGGQPEIFASTTCTSRSTIPGAPGALVRLQPGGFPEGRDRRSGQVQGLQDAVHLRHDLCLRQGHGGAAGIELRQGQGAPEAGRLRRNAGRPWQPSPMRFGRDKARWKCFAATRTHGSLGTLLRKPPT